MAAMQIYLSWGGAWCEIGFRALGCFDLRSGLCSVAWNALLSQIAFDDELGEPTSLSSDSVTQEVWFLTPSSPPKCPASWFMCPFVPRVTGISNSV